MGRGALEWIRGAPARCRQRLAALLYWCWHAIVSVPSRLYRAIVATPDRCRRALAWSARRARYTARIARWELGTGVDTLDRRTVLVLGVVLLAGAAAAPATLGAGGSGLDDGIYRVAVDEDHQYHDPVVERASLRVVDDADRAELVLATDGPLVVNELENSKEQAALSELRAAVEAYNGRQLAAENDTAAAFPVVVDVTYTEQPGSPLLERSGTGEGNGGGGGAGGAVGGGDGGADDGTGDGTSDGTTTDGDSSGDGESGDGSDGGSGGDGGSSGDSTDDSTDDGAGGDSSGTDGSQRADGGDGGGLFSSIGGQFTGRQSGTPADISPPFPFGSLVLAFLFVVPMNFVIQAYASTIVEERLNRRGELLLVSPVTRLDIVGGKTLPYLAVMVALTVGIAVLVGGGLLSVVAVLPVAVLFLATTFVAAMFARSYKELTFLTVTISVVLTSYVFIPAIFTDVTPIALISPLTLVVLDLQREAVSHWAVVFSTAPFLLSSAVLYGLGLGVYREEDMFTQRPVHRKALDALAAWISKPWHVAATSGTLLPFAFVLELLAVAVLFAVPQALALPVIMVVVATIEEVVKSVHVYAAFEHGRFERGARTALLLGVASGTGFFVAEKATHAIQLIGLHELPIGQLTFTPSLAAGPVLGFALFLLPLALHCATAAISALGARRGSGHYAVGLGIAILVHAAYNVGVIAVVA